MKFERTKNATRNIFFGGLLKLYQTIIPFILRTIMIRIMGAEYTGLNGLFTSILQVLNLAELGVGSAMVYSMYRPVAEDDKPQISALLNLYRKYYRIIGLVILLVGLCISPVIPKLVKADTVPAGINIFVLYFMNLFATVLSYWLYAYKNSLLTAYQRTDVSSKITLLCSTVTYALQIIIVIFFKDFYLYYAITLGVGILNNIVTAWIVKKMYPDIQPCGQLKKADVVIINQRVKDLFTSKVGVVFYNSADTIVISAFLGMTALTIYQNYHFLITAIGAFVGIISTSILSGVGNSIVTETREKNFDDLCKFTFLFSWIACICSTCLLCMYQPFMEIWVGKDLMVDFSVVILFVVFFYESRMSNVLNLYKDASGMWHEDKFRPLIVAIINLVLNIVSVKYIGIMGIILSTVISSVFVGDPWLILNMFSHVFERKSLKYYLRNLFLYVITAIACCSLALLFCQKITCANLWICLLIRLIISLVVSIVIYYLAFCRTIEFKKSVALFFTMLGKKELANRQ